MVRVAVTVVVVASSEIDDGLSTQPIFAVDEDRLHERVTVPLKPPVAVTVIVEVAACPAEEIVTLVGLANTE